MGGFSRCRSIKRWTALCIPVLLLAAFLIRPARAASFVVNSLGDTNDGSCSPSHCTLREAINAANASAGADTITFSVSGTINLGSDLPALSASGGALTIDGVLRSVVVDGGDLYDLFFVPSGAELNLKNLTLRNGHAPVSGGAVYSFGTLSLEKMTVESCSADDYGGGIYSAGTLTINASYFTDNIAESFDGGAIYLYKGTASITDSGFGGNRAGFSGGAIFNRYHAENQGGDLTITDSDFFQNIASSGFGGALANQSILAVNGSVFGLNSAEDGGGAFYNKTGGSYIIVDSMFSLNNATLGSGGAIYVQDAPTSGNGSVRDSSLNSNIALQHGGGFYISAGRVNFTRTRIFNNQAGQNGGGGYNANGYVDLTDASVESNDADLDGGGFYNRGRMSVERSTFSGNEALGLGGGIYHADSTEISGITNSTFYDNRANQGGGIYSRADLHVVNATLSANSASAGEGGGFNANTSTSLYNSIVANSPSGGNCKTTQFPSNWGDNIDSGTTCNFGTLHDSHSNTDPLLGPLKDNGGWTKTMMPQPGSLAIDGVTYVPIAHRVPEDDQRQYVRPYGAFIDIGAVEGYYLTYLSLVRR